MPSKYIVGLIALFLTSECNAQPAGRSGDPEVRRFCAHQVPKDEKKRKGCIWKQTQAKTIMQMIKTQYNTAKSQEIMNICRDKSQEPSINAFDWVSVSDCWGEMHKKIPKQR